MTCYSFFSCGEFSWSEDRICCDWSKAILRVNIIGAYLNNETNCKINCLLTLSKYTYLMCYHVSFYEKITFFGWLRALLVSLQQRPLLTLQSLLVRQSSPEIGNIRFHSLIYHYTNENNETERYLYENDISNVYFDLNFTNTK